MLTPTIASALEYCVHSMKDCKLRKDGTIAFYHPIRVASTLAKYGCDDETIIVGLLHDLIEDTEVTADEISERFSMPIADLVVALSHELDEKVQVTIDRVRQGGMKAIMVKLADNTDNIRTIEFFKPEKRKAYLHYAMMTQKLGEEMLGSLHPLVALHLAGLEDATKKISK